MPAWLLRNWKGLGAAIALLSPAKDAILWALDWRGRYDAAIQSYNELGGWAAIIAHILNPPPWFSLLAAIIGVALVFLHFRVNYKKINSQVSESNPTEDQKLPFSKMSDEQIAAASMKFAKDIRIFESNCTEFMISAINSNADHKHLSSRLMFLSDKKKLEFNNHYRFSSISYIKELQARLERRGILKPYLQNYEDFRLVESTLETGMLAGPSPVSEVADYMECLARRLVD